MNKTLWIVVGNTKEYGRVYLPSYAGNQRYEVEQKIMEGARRESFAGTLSERLEYLGWEVVCLKIEEDLNGDSKLSTEDILTNAEARQFLGDEVPGFGSVLAEALGLSTKNLYDKIEHGEVTKLAALASLAKLVINQRQNGVSDGNH